MPGGLTPGKDLIECTCSNPFDHDRPQKLSCLLADLRGSRAPSAYAFSDPSSHTCIFNHAHTVRNFEHITNRDDHAYDDSRAIEISGADLLSIAKAPFLAISIS